MGFSAVHRPKGHDVNVGKRGKMFGKYEGDYQRLNASSLEERELWCNGNELAVDLNCAMSCQRKLCIGQVARRDIVLVMTMVRHR